MKILIQGTHYFFSGNSGSNLTSTWLQLTVPSLVCLHTHTHAPSLWSLHTTLVNVLITFGYSHKSPRSQLPLTTCQVAKGKAEKGT